MNAVSWSEWNIVILLAMMNHTQNVHDQDWNVSLKLTECTRRRPSVFVLNFPSALLSWWAGIP
jgi:hypothetical protein